MSVTLGANYGDPILLSRTDPLLVLMHSIRLSEQHELLGQQAGLPFSGSLSFSALKGRFDLSVLLTWWGWSTLIVSDSATMGLRIAKTI